MLCERASVLIRLNGSRNAKEENCTMALYSFGIVIWCTINGWICQEQTVFEGR
jgi:hypothetical protein